MREKQDDNSSLRSSCSRVHEISSLGLSGGNESTRISCASINCHCESNNQDGKLPRSGSHTSSSSASVIGSEENYIGSQEFMSHPFSTCKLNRNASSKSLFLPGANETSGTNSTINYYMATPTDQVPEKQALPNPDEASSNELHFHQNLSLRKCETALVLSNMDKNSNPSSNTQEEMNSAGKNAANPIGKVRMMKEKIFSTSYSALNSVLSSGRTTSKLFSTLKLSGSTQSNHVNGCCSSKSEPSSSASTKNVCAARLEENNKTVVSCEMPHSSELIDPTPFRTCNKSKSEISIPETVCVSFGPSGSDIPLTPVNRLRRAHLNVASQPCNNGSSGGGDSGFHEQNVSRSSSMSSFQELQCKLEEEMLCVLCLSRVPLEHTVEIMACNCRYCKDVSFPLLCMICACVCSMCVHRVEKKVFTLLCRISV